MYQNAKPVVDSPVPLPATTFSMNILHDNHDSSSSSNSFSSEAGQSTSQTSLTTPPMLKPSPLPRRIRFAPLPDPRRAVLIMDDGNELPIKDDTHFPAATSLSVLQKPNLASAETQSQTPLSGSDPDPILSQSTSASPTPSAFSSPPVSHPSTSNIHSPTPQSRSFTVNILKPFKRPPSPGRSKKRKSRPLSFTPEEILTLGTINLFHSASLPSDRDSFKENNDPSVTPSSPFNSLVGGWGLSRRASVNPSSPNNPQTGPEIVGNNPPLTRSQSVEEGNDRKKNRSSITSFFSSAPGVSAFVDLKSKNQKAKSKATLSPTSTSSSSASGSTINKGGSASPFILPSQRTPRHKGARMLNGRIYGAKRQNRISENPFANARDEEPEFVEWGYGGMGSVKGARSAGVVGNNGPGAVNWERLLGGSAVSGQAQTGWAVPGGGRGGAAARVKKGEAEKERRSGESARTEDEDEDDDGSGLAWVKRRRRLREEKEKRMLEQEKLASQESDAVPASQVTGSETQTTIKPSDNDSHPGSRKGTEELQLTQNMGSFSHPEHVMKAIPMPPRLLSQHRKTSSRGLAEGVENNATAVEDIPIPHPSSAARLAASESSSTTSSGESSEDEGSSDGEVTSEEDQEEDEKRRTAIGAGVEKVTASFRHRSD